jgi:hypothetical protein
MGATRKGAKPLRPEEAGAVAQVDFKGCSA